MIYQTDRPSIVSYYSQIVEVRCDQPPMRQGDLGSALIWLVASANVTILVVNLSEGKGTLVPSALAIEGTGGDEHFAGPHDNRLRQVHSAIMARRRQQAHLVACAGVHLEHRDTPPDLDAFNVEAGFILRRYDSKAATILKTNASSGWDRHLPTPIAQTSLRAKSRA